MIMVVVVVVVVVVVYCNNLGKWKLTLAIILIDCLFVCWVF
jgi:hypothetical protein